MADTRFDATTTTTCGYCGVGCRLEAHTRGRAHRLDQPRDGRPCEQGPHLRQGPLRAPVRPLARPPDRAARPRERRLPARRPGTRRSTASPRSSSRIKAEHGPDAIAGLASSRATNEDCYAMQRVFRAAIGTHNIDNCSRVCHSPTSFALRKSLGLLGLLRLLRRHRVRRGDCCSSAPTRPQAHPVVGARMKQAALKGLKLDHRRPAPDRARRLRRAPPAASSPGTNAALPERARARAHPRRPRRRATSSTSAPRASTRSPSCVAAYTPEAVEEITGVPAADIERRRTSTARRSARASSGASASPSTATARSACS